MTKTFYDVLDVAPDATTEEIRVAYRERLKESHPDLNDDEDAGATTRRIIRARDVLTDDDRRRRYDRVGHEAFVGDSDATVDASDVSDAARAARRAGWDGTGESGSGTTDESRSAGDSRSPGNGHAQERRAQERRRRERDARERRRRERKAREQVDSDRSQDPSDGSRRESESDQAGDATANTASNATANAATDRTANTATDGTANAATDRTANATTDATANDGNGSGAVSGSSGPWNTGDGYSVRRGRGGDVRRSPLLPSRQSLPLLGAAFVLYPVMLFSALFPAFPLVVNVVVGLCLLFLVGYLQSVPRVGVVVFGGWSLATPVAFAFAGIPLTGLVGVIALSATWLPFGLSVLTFSLVRP